MLTIEGIMPGQQQQQQFQKSMVESIGTQKPRRVVHVREKESREQAPPPFLPLSLSSAFIFFVFGPLLPESLRLLLLVLLFCKSPYRFRPISWLLLAQATIAHTKHCNALSFSLSIFLSFGKSYRCTYGSIEPRNANFVLRFIPRLEDCLQLSARHLQILYVTQDHLRKIGHCE